MYSWYICIHYYIRSSYSYVRASARTRFPRMVYTAQDCVPAHTHHAAPQVATSRKDIGIGSTHVVLLESPQLQRNNVAK